MNTSQKSPSALIWLVLSIVLILLDQWTKHIATANLQYGESVPFIAGFWDWTLAHNTGAAFSFLANSGEWAHWFFRRDENNGKPGADRATFQNAEKSLA